MADEDEGPGPISPAGTIVVGVDGSEHSLQALGWAADQARVERRALTLLVGVHPSTPTWLDPTADSPREGHLLSLRTKGDEILARVRDECADALTGLEVIATVVVADPRSTLLEMSRTAALIVVGSRGLGPLSSLLLGSTSAAVVRRAECPVVVHRSPLAAQRHGVAVGLDLRPDSGPVLELAYRMAMLRAQPLFIVHARVAGEPSGPGADEDPWSAASAAHVADWISELNRKYPEVEVETIVGRGRAEQVLMRLTETVGLLVVGVHHRGRIAELTFGTTALWMVEHAPCPVVAVPLGASILD